MEKVVTISFEGQNLSKLTNRLNRYDLKKKLTREVALTLPWGYIPVYYHSSQTYLRSRVSVYRTIGPLVSILLLMRLCF